MPAACIDILDTGHAFQRNRDIARARIAATRKAGKTTLRHDRLAVAITDGKCRRDLPGVCRTQHGERQELAGAAGIAAVAAADGITGQHCIWTKGFDQVVDDGHGSGLRFNPLRH